ncbi:hypothetical protein A2U01_0022644 [Trifolium medium]|uniref:Uncharacterized protein n=1 Tax=Trifolium medium TaxID=97028 RepID=A0A392NP25_9FABA|nr:hypothetical protein [Trifolium medium]
MWREDIPSLCPINSNLQLLPPQPSAYCPRQSHHEREHRLNPLVAAGSVTEKLQEAHVLLSGGIGIACWSALGSWDAINRAVGSWQSEVGIAKY